VNRCSVWVVAVVLAVCTARLTSAAADPREMKAREAFAAGRYQEALDLFAKLYAESLNPIYLRNTGRCHQNLGDPDRAIASFRDYLRKATKLPAAERKEIEGYIKEMEELKRQKEASATSAPPPRATPVEPVTPLPREAPPPSAPGSSSASASVVMTPPPPPPAEQPSPIYGRWWFWAIVGGVVVAGLGAAAAAGVFTQTEDAKCPTGITCQ
jgi:hypothetical protein